MYKNFIFLYYKLWVKYEDIRDEKDQALLLSPKFHYAPCEVYLQTTSSLEVKKDRSGTNNADLTERYRGRKFSVRIRIQRLNPSSLNSGHCPEHVKGFGTTGIDA